MRPTVILLCGLPFSGKSTVAAALAEDGYAVISLDTINHEQGLGKEGASIPGSAWSETHRIANERLAEYVKSGKDVVWDDTNYAAWIRDPLFETAVNLGGDPVVVHIEASEQVVRARATENSILKTRHESSVEDFERVIGHFEKPCCGIRIDGNQSKSNVISAARRALRQGVLQ